MTMFYYTVFGLIAVASFLTEFKKSGGDQDLVHTKDFTRFSRNYILVYALMMAGDWLQGPFVYALYQHYEFHRQDIGRLFIVGFGSSMVIGTIVGSLADKTGRKKAALTYVLTYTLGCMTKHFNNFNVLAIGRLFCGVATSLLYSAFESWLVAEHFKRNYSSDLLGYIFSKSVLIGNGLMAIVAGLLGHVLVETLNLGPVAPFDAAAIVLLIGGGIILLTWPENFGDSQKNKSLTEQIVESVKVVGRGMIFSIFMMSCMWGSAVAGHVLSNSKTVSIERFLQLVFLVSAAAMSVPAIFHMTKNDESDSLLQNAPEIGTGGRIQLAAFCVFEFCVGTFWPLAMKLRSEHVPEEMRATVINLFRVPLNLFVCIVLYNVSAYPLSAMFLMCTFFLLVCVICQSRLHTLTHAARVHSREASQSKATSAV